MGQIPDINDNELGITETKLMQCYAKKKDSQIIDTDIRLDSSNHELTECPAQYCQDNDCHFIVVNTAWPNASRLSCRSRSIMNVLHRDPWKTDNNAAHEFTN